ncbi:MAG: hypothetical protein HUJ61_05265, partial [Bacilli bacterium]|nr:hypothetical protein [Bacilli bacterium]
KYRLSKNHPFLVAIITESTNEDGKIYLTGFNMTRSINYVLSRPNRFIRIDNPNPDDDAPSFVCIDPVKNKEIKYFSKPMNNWELSDEDILQIDELVKEKLK